MKQYERDDFGRRMKEYEKVSQTRLMKRTPVVIRVDGKCFHTFAKDFDKPFDKILVKTMQQTTKYLCENIQGCVLGYTQSDEISLLLVDYKNINTQPWFDNEIQKMCSIAASMATMVFNKSFSDNACDFGYYGYELEDDNDIRKNNLEIFQQVYSKAVGNAMFDARVYNIPKDEVTNYFYWRQSDAVRNSIQMLGQANFSHKELQKKSGNDIKTMLLEKGIVFDEIPTNLQRGSCFIRNEIIISMGEQEQRSKLCNYKGSEKAWVIDENIPIFKGEGRKYIDDILFMYDQGKAW